VPYRHRPNFWVSLLRAIIMLPMLGVITIASAPAGSVGGGSDTWLLGITGIAMSVVLNLVLFLLAFRILTTEDVSWGDVFPGALIAALAWTALQAIGGYIVSHQLQGASDMYGAFAIVIGLLAWIYLGAQMTLFAAEVNVVRKQRLSPRAIVQPPLTDADQRALNSYAEQEERRPEEDVIVYIDQTRTTTTSSNEGRRSRCSDRNRRGTESTGTRAHSTSTAVHGPGLAQPLKVETRVQIPLGLPGETSDDEQAHPPDSHLQRRFSISESACGLTRRALARQPVRRGDSNS